MKLQTGDDFMSETPQYISSITLPNGKIYLIQDENAITSSDLEEALSNVVLSHKLTFGAGGVYEFDGSADVTVPVYTGTSI